MTPVCTQTLCFFQKRWMRFGTLEKSRNLILGMRMAGLVGVFEVQYLYVPFFKPSRFHMRKNIQKKAQQI